MKLGTLVNQYSWRICTKQLKLKPWCIASMIVSKKSGGAEAPLAPPYLHPCLCWHLLTKFAKLSTSNYILIIIMVSLGYYKLRHINIIA